MVESQPESALMAEEEEDDDDEWEYEYHETETESFYVTLDISAAANHNKLGTKRKEPDPPPSDAPQRIASPGPQVNAGSSEPPLPETSVPMDVDPTLEQPEEDTSFSAPQNRIQILDLHTQNPLISYENQLYSCEWTSTLGTDVLLIAPTPDFPHQILREFPNVSVLATSSIKLMGRPAQISSRHTAEEASTPAPESSTTSSATAAAQVEKAAPTPVKIPLGPTPTRARQSQANFLERLIAIKAKKGEKDKVTIYTQKVNQGTGWRSQRKAMEDGEEGNETTTAQQQPQSQTGKRGKATTGRPRGSRRLRGPRTAKGGLFRDYRPQLWDTPGADIRAGSTPESWDQLEGVATAAAAPPSLIEPSARTVSASARASPTPASRPAAQSLNGDAGDAVADLATEPQPLGARQEDAVVAADVEMDDV